MGLLNDLVAAPAASELTLAERLELAMNDEDNSARILSSYGRDMVFVEGRGWAVWDGRRYSLRSGELAAYEIGHKLRQLVLEEAEYALREMEVADYQIAARIDEAIKRRPPVLLSYDDAIDEIRRETAKTLRVHAVKCGNRGRVKTALETCQYQVRTEVGDMDRDVLAFVVPNGQIDLRAVAAWKAPDTLDPAKIAASKGGWLRPVDRAALPTRCAGVPFDPSATCDAWLDFLDLILPDPEVRDCVQRILGACLRGTDAAQVAVFLRGHGGNGKSTLLNLISHVFGERDGYGAPCKIEMFLDTGTASSAAANPDEMNLPGARILIAAEPSPRDVLDMKKIKSLTGGDRRISRANFGNFFEWMPKGIPLISCNRTPKIKDSDEGTKRRLIFVPFDVNLRELPVEQRRNQREVEAELRAQASGILNWILDGYRDFIAHGEEIDPPEVMQDLKNSLMQGSDPVGVFLKQMTTKQDSGRISVSDFYKVHEAWCLQEGRQLYQMKNFGDALIECGLERGPIKGRSHWKGIIWSEDALDIVEQVTGSRPAQSAAPNPPPF